MCDLHDRGPDTAGPRTITDLVDELVVAVTNARIYDPRHPRVQTSLEALETCLEGLCAAGGHQVIQLGAADGYLFFDHRPLLGASLAAPKLLEPLQSLGAGGIGLTRGATRVELSALVEVLGRELKRIEDRAAANRYLTSVGAAHVELLAPYSRGGGQARLQVVDGSDIPPPPALGSPGRASTPILCVPAHLYQGVVSTLQDMMIRAARGDQLDLASAQTFVERAVQQLDAQPHELLRLSRYERYDAFTFGHSIRVGLLAISFARTLTDAPDFLLRIGIAALMHDIGKARVPFEILHSTGHLDEEQRSAMNRHTEHGGRILLDMEDSEPMAIAAALGHHRTVGGGGYPRTLHEVQLSTCTRMVKICDVYEALTAVRPYKDRMSPTRAYRIMMSMQDHFDRALLKWFIYVNGIYPVGSNVRLSTGERAVVVARTRSLAYPVVLLEQDTNRAGERLDLSAPGGEPVEIEALVHDQAA